MDYRNTKRAAARGTLAFGASLAAMMVAGAAFARAPEGQASAGAAAQPAAAANTNAAASTGDIVVTAQFRSQRLQDVPLAITAVNSAMLEARSQTNIAEVAKQAPSVVIIPAAVPSVPRSARRSAASASSTSIRRTNRASACISTMSIMRR
jgi:outer membrane receptor protein involved in Fe transport